MNIFQTILARSLETSIRARIGLDADAREAMSRLDGKKIQLNLSDTSIGLSSANGLPVVIEGSMSSPDLEITGSLTSVGQVLMASDTSNAVVSGDAKLLDDLNLIFHPNMFPDDLIEKGKVFASTGLSVARTTIEGLAEQLGNLRASKSDKTDLQKRIDKLEEELRELKAKLEERDS